ncbi:F-box protein At5g07610-like [Lotus japonicus]|uniref:F-box protein At5g07610-like n=1 Tax=Lotus japonicus TaxID=34305 RepID=UPI00258AE116|nr:F-box protein At5g07610-like [Lotus japonicus]
MRFITLDFDFIVLRSCNGLLLCRLAFCSDSYFIYNPITRDFTNLNLGTHPLSRQSYIIDHYLAFDPSVSSPFYKVVSLAVSRDSPLDWVFHVYTIFQPHSPRIGPPVSVSIPFPLAWESDSDRGVYCNGAIHWCNRGDFSVYFDVDAQCLKYYSMPLSNSDEWLKTRIYYFGESGGHLHLILPEPEPLKENQKPSFYDIFELKEDYSGWLLTHRIDMKSIRLQFTHMRSCFNYYIFHKNKSSISVLIVAREGAIINDPVDNTSTKLCDFEIGTSIWIRLAQGRVVPHFDILC